MASGGFRPGAGRPKGAKAPKAKPVKVAPDIKKAARQSGMSPLDYMLTVMNDDSSDSERRDRMAIAAAPYVHARASDAAGGKKEQQQEEAERLSREGKFATPPPPPSASGD
ncbi:hypothetical protein KGO5_04236 [Sinorhizobium sp. KGO-5]|nr:hypothetical protein KGO5_04236 [Sinorhizobium sp. KGO-5]